MNKIFKIIWSKTKNSYIVVSEIAKRKGKCSSGLNKKLLAAFLAAGTVLSVTGSAWAADTLTDEYIKVHGSGNDASATAAGAIAIGASSSANYNCATVIGYNASAAAINTVPLGYNASAAAESAVALGYNAKAEGEGSFAFGAGAISAGTGTVAFTGGNKAYGTYSMAWGYNSVAGISVDGSETYVGATAFGTGTEARNGGATAMGNWSIAEGQDSVAMGNESHTHADAKASLAMGQESHTLGSGSLAGGTSSIAGGYNSLAFGYEAEGVSDYTVALGESAKAVGENSVALGYNSKAFGDYSAAILGGRTGNGTFKYDEDENEYDVDVKDNAIGAFAAGFGSVALKDYTVAVGRHATVNNEKGIALGEDAVVSADNSAALGSEAVASEENVISVGHKKGDAKYDGSTYSAALNRRIVNVAEGVDDTDAVNVSQLKALEVEVVGAGNVKVEKDTSSGHTKYTVSSAGGGGAAEISFNGDNKDARIDSPNVLNIEGGATGELTDGNIGVKSDGKNTLNVKLAKDIKGVDSITVNKNIKVGDNTTIEGDAITTKTVNADTVKVGSTTINAGGITTDNGNGPSVTKDGIDAGKKKITNVAPGTADTDAATVGQINNAFGDVRNDINRLDDRMKKGLAGAAALAALHPMDFDPDSKLTLAAGVGNYRSASAGAIGAFYRPADNVMFSLGGSFGNGENMVNAGVSFALDRVNRATPSRTAMAKEITALREQVAKQDEQIARQDEQIAKQDEQIARLTEMVNKLAGREQQVKNS